MEQFDHKFQRNEAVIFRILVIDAFQHTLRKITLTETDTVDVS